MFTKQLTSAILATGLVLAPAARLSADTGDAIAGAIIGGAIVGAISNAEKKKKRTVYVTPGSAATRAENSEIQTSLNYFGFPAGVADGVLGRNSRNAISQYQAFMGYPATGQLTQYERDFLVGSYHRAIAGGAATTQMIAANPMGPRGLLKTYQQEAAGMTPTTPVVTQPQAAPPATTAATPAAPSGAMPSFIGAGESASLASHCNQVSLVTSSNGGFTTEASMTDADFALSEQFCLARTYAIASSEEIIAQVRGYTPQQITEQCQGFVPALREHVAALSLKPMNEVMQGVGDFVLQSGMAPAQLAGTARVCLGVGYRTDNMDLALGSGLLLTALGEQPYAELMGHHLSQGFGASRRTDLAMPWYEAAAQAIGNGAVPVFAPGQPERNGLIIKAAYQVGGRSGVAAPAPAPAAPQPAALPSFPVQK
ncbi:peptidoglycan-binding domain-containing protein [Actibacterium sp. MT2.3-13A]|uniref:peptidoglycan-binding domain-containing protein n=1 Tax=Actibacterium sp. MT2.3-13A TaxID=2828332 RepID=UPI001BAE2966|nr:peptidoglycan-binding domain-containing protein [Actibacterium sp. MT2.3-13A]